MKKLILLSSILMMHVVMIHAQTYDFKEVVNIEHQAVISQGKTSTCWSFSTSSFIESEIYRISQKNIDISEMYSVRVTYPAKIQNYVMRQGKAQFSQGALAHDVINSVKNHGLVPQTVFTGLVGQQSKYNHKNIIPQIKEVLDVVIKNKSVAKHLDWKTYTENVLDEKIGKKPMSFKYKGKKYTPKSFLKYTGFDPNQYITLTSFQHQPYHTDFILNIPDNFSNGVSRNIPLDDLVKTTKNALRKGYTLTLDCDVSEKTFSPKYGVAVLPEKLADEKKSMTEIVSEKKVTPNYREQEFNNFHTTDDHLMHIVGLVKDVKGNEYFKVKNSWGGNSDRVGNNGYVYMSIPYFRAKTISVLLHKSAYTK